MKRSWKIALILLLILAIFLVWALWSGLVVRSYAFRTRKLPAGAKLRLALLCDLHSSVYGENHAALIELVAGQQPDAILLGGDIVDDQEPLENALSFFEALSRLDIPVYYVSGNHDRMRPDFESVIETVKGYGVRVIEGESVLIEVAGASVRLCGLRDCADAQSCADALAEAFSDLDGEAYNILLSHRPEYIDLYRLYPFDLVLCGHTHGGQVRLPPLLNGLFAPNQGWFPKYAGGLYDVDGTQMVISRGLSRNPRLPRVFNPPEVVIVDLEGEA